MKLNDNFEGLTKQLLDVIPEFAPIYDEHLSDNEGKELIYMVFGDLSRFYVENWLQGNKETTGKIQKYLNELVLTNNRNIVELVDFGFLENLVKYVDEVKYRAVVKDLPPILQREIEKVDEFWNKSKESLG